jgi:hypothetical protein
MESFQLSRRLLALQLLIPAPPVFGFKLVLDPLASLLIH